MRNNKRRANRGGFTLSELTVAVMISLIVVLSAGMILAGNQKGWSAMFDRVYSDVVTDGYVAKRGFDAIVRKSSIFARLPVLGSTNEFVEVYYYDNVNSAEPDRWARFYTSGGELLVDHGNIDPSTGNTLTAWASMPLARNVTSVSFSVIGTNVRMLLNLDNSRELLEVRCSAVRHSY